MKTYVCDVCKTNRSDEGTVYHLTVEKISPDYARNFICDFILGKKQDIGQLSLF